MLICNYQLAEALYDAPDSPGWDLGIYLCLFNTSECVQFLNSPQVRAYPALGMVRVSDKLFRIDAESTRQLCPPEEFDRRIAAATAFAIRRVVPVAFTDGWQSQRLGSRLGAYLLFFGSSRRGVPHFSDSVVVHKWAPGLRTCRDWLVVVQRRARAARRARKSLAFAMALHGRLGRCAEVACLGPDLAEYVCSLLN